MNTKGQKRNDLAAALDLAARDRTLRDIAQEAAVPYGSLKNLRSHGYLGPERATSLRAWLAANGYLPGADDARAHTITITPADPLPQAAALLRDTAALLTNETIPRPQRIALLQTQQSALQILTTLLTAELKPKP